MRAWWWLLMAIHLVWGSTEPSEDFYDHDVSSSTERDSQAEEDFQPNATNEPQEITTSSKLSPWEEERVKKQPKFHSWGGKRYENEDDKNEDYPDQTESEHEDVSRGRSLTPMDSRFLQPNETELNFNEGNTLTKTDAKRVKQSPRFSSWSGKRDPEVIRDLLSLKKPERYSSLFPSNVFGSSTPEQSLKRYPSFYSLSGKRSTPSITWGRQRKDIDYEDEESFNNELYSTLLDTDNQYHPSNYNLNTNLENMPQNSLQITLDTKNEQDLEPVSETTQFKRAFNNLGLNRLRVLNKWAGKRPSSFNSWGGKRFNRRGEKKKPAFNSWGGKRSAAFNSWGGKRSDPSNIFHDKRSAAFNSWGGKRSDPSNTFHDKRWAAFNSWGGKRSDPSNIFHDKRSAAFNSWGGKRSDPLNRFDGKGSAAFNSWGGKRSAAFNSWGGKRSAAINSWDGKRSAAFNSWGGKRSAAFNSWGGKRTPFPSVSNPSNGLNTGYGKPLNSPEMFRKYSHNTNDKLPYYFIFKYDDSDENNYKKYPLEFSRFSLGDEELHENKYFLPNTPDMVRNAFSLNDANDLSLEKNQLPNIDLLKLNYLKELKENKEKPHLFLPGGKYSSFSNDYGNNLPTKLLKNNGKNPPKLSTFYLGNKELILLENNKVLQKTPDLMENIVSQSENDDIGLDEMQLQGSIADKLSYKNKLIEKRDRPPFSSWAGKRNPLFSNWYSDNLPTVFLDNGKKRPAFYSLGGKRSVSGKNIENKSWMCETSIKQGKNCQGKLEMSFGSGKYFQTTEGESHARAKREVRSSNKRDKSNECISCKNKKGRENVKKNKLLTRMYLQGGLNLPVTFKFMPKVIDFYAWGGKRS